MATHSLKVWHIYFIYYKNQLNLTRTHLIFPHYAKKIFSIVEITKQYMDNFIIMLHKIIYYDNNKVYNRELGIWKNALVVHQMALSVISATSWKDK